MFAKLKSAAANLFGRSGSKTDADTGPKVPSNLTAAEQKQIREVIDRAKPNATGMPQTAQESIPFERMFPDGICRVSDNYYTKTILFQDINYQQCGASMIYDPYVRHRLPLCKAGEGVDAGIDDRTQRSRWQYEACRRDLRHRDSAHTQQEDQAAIFEEWCSFLNFFDSSIRFELSFVNTATDQGFITDVE